MEQESEFETAVYHHDDSNGVCIPCIVVDIAITCCIGICSIS